MIGKKLSHYEILEELHRGGMGLVYRARDEKLNREVALKVLPPELMSEADRRRRFVQEAKASASLEHPHIAVVHEIDEDDGVIFIAMELIGGSTLAARLEAGAMPPAETLSILEQVAAGLAYAHGKGIIHRDLKPSNIMLSPQGHPKLIDFGLAKLLDAQKSPFLDERAESEAALRSDTREGLLVGTVSYMSPEQARGGKVDHRSDIFSFGLVLYHTLAGEPPFQGPSRIDTLHGILRDPTPELPPLEGVAREPAEAIGEIVRRCLEKDPSERYQTMTQVSEALRRARYQLETTPVAPPAEPEPKRSWLTTAAVTAGSLALLSFLALLFFVFRQEPAPVEPAKPSLAVLHFENLSGDPELEWLRMGLTDMIVTDLSQSPDIRVLGTNQLHQIMVDMNRRETSDLPSDAIAELAERAQVEAVLVGSFAKLGDAIRLNARLQDASTGQVIASERVEGQGQESIFRLVDDLTQRVRAHYELEGDDAAEMEMEAEVEPKLDLDRDLREVTTASVEAYRHYAKGIELHEQYREEEAIPAFERAIELDPGFAMALAKLGVVHNNLGMEQQADDYAERALAHLDRLSARERFYIEGWYYSRQPETLSKAIDAYRQALEVYPDHGSVRHNLANLLYSAERYEEAVREFEVLRRGGMTFPATYQQLAGAYAALGDVPRARRVLEEYSDRYPESWTTRLSLAELLIVNGRVEQGLAQVERAESLGASPAKTHGVRWIAQILAEDWEAALTSARVTAESDSPIDRFNGGRNLAITGLYLGEADEVLDELESYLEEASKTKAPVNPPRLFRGFVLLEKGEYEKAIEAGRSITGGGREFNWGAQGLFIEALASQHLGRTERALELAEAYHEQIEPALGMGPERYYYYLVGELARIRGDYDEAIASLSEAESMLPMRGPQGQHSAIWYSLASAHRAAGNDDEALRWYQRLVDSREERLYDPIHYVRSFFFLGELESKRGRYEAARRNYRRFLEHWEQGDLDEDRVDLAEDRLEVLLDR